VKRIAVLLLLVFLGCGRQEDMGQQPRIDNTPMSPAGKSVKAEHPAWRNSICNEIADQRVSILMDQEQVRAAWGEPQKVIVVERPGVKQEIWLWYGDPFFPRKIVFEFKRAMEIHDPQ